MHYFHDEKEVRTFHEENTDLNLFDAETQQELLPLHHSGDRGQDQRRDPPPRASWSSCTKRRTIQKLMSELAPQGSQASSTTPRRTSRSSN